MTGSTVARVARPPSSHRAPDEVSRTKLHLALPGGYAPPMPVDIDSIFRGGGKRLLDLLDFCVRAVEMDPLLELALQPVRASWLQRQAMPASAAPAAPAAYHLPSKYLFDTVALHLRETSPALRRIRRRYRVRRSPVENLPDGRMNQAQRRF